MDFMTWLLVTRPSGRYISVRTAQKYVSEVQGWHRRTFGYRVGGDLDMGRLRDLAKGFRRALGDGKKRRRHGVRTQHLAKALKQCFNLESAEHLNWRAALSTAFCALLRGTEFALQEGEEFDPELHLTRGDLKFYREHGILHVKIMIRPAKSDKHLRGKAVPIILKEGGSLLDPVRELYKMVRADYVPREQRASTPLFRWPSGAAFRVSEVRYVVRNVMVAIGLDGSLFGAHSLRIGGATAALASGMDPSLIRMMGRWSSDIYEIYCRMCKQTAVRVGVTIGSTAFNDVEGGAFTTEELEMLPFEMNNMDVDLDDADDLEFSDDEMNLEDEM